MPPLDPPRVAGVGGAVVDHYEDLGLAFPGGNGPNVAVHAARAGARVVFVGVVGDDAGGDLIRRSLAAEGVDVSRLRVVPGRTPVLTVRRDRAGDFQCVACPRRLLPFVPEEGDLDRLAGCDLVHLASTARCPETLPLLRGRVEVCYDLGYGAADAGDLLPAPPWGVVLSRPGLARAEAARAAAAVGALGHRLVVVTHGADGATAWRDGEVCHRRAAEAAPLDTLGAGDALLACLTVRLLQGESLGAALEAASASAAAACGHHGGFGRGEPASQILPEEAAGFSLLPGTG